MTVAIESRFGSEEDLHSAVAAHPDVLPAEDVGLGLLVPLANELDLGHGPIDLLCADATGRLVIVEFKRGSENPDVRKVVAQVLDYGASLWRVSYGDLEQGCARCAPGFEGSLADHVADRLAELGQSEFDAEGFRRGVADVLDSGGFVFMYVGRDLDPRTKRIMTFLAEGPRMEFFAVEVDYFVSEGGDTEVLVPRTAFVPSWAAAGSPGERDKAALPIEERLAEAPVAVREAIRLMDGLAEDLGLVTGYGRSSRMYRPADGEQGVAVYASLEKADVNLLSLRDWGMDAEADRLQAAIADLAGKPVTKVWPGIDCQVLVANWEAARERILEPYFAIWRQRYP